MSEQELTATFTQNPPIWGGLCHFFYWL